LEYYLRIPICEVFGGAGKFCGWTVWMLSSEWPVNYVTPWSLITWK